MPINRDRKGQAVPSFDTRADALEWPDDALVGKRRQRASHRVAIDPEPGGQHFLRRHHACIVEFAAVDRQPDPVGDLAPERNARLTIH